MRCMTIVRETWWNLWLSAFCEVAGVGKSWCWSYKFEKFTVKNQTSSSRVHFTRCFSIPVVLMVDFFSNICSYVFLFLVCVICFGTCNLLFLCSSWVCSSSLFLMALLSSSCRPSDLSGPNTESSRSPFTCSRLKRSCSRTLSFSRC